MSGFDFTESQLELQAGVRKLCEGFDADYWRQVDETGDFPEAFVSAMAAGGWLATISAPCTLMYSNFIPSPKYRHGGWGIQPPSRPPYIIVRISLMMLFRIGVSR